MPFWDDTFKKIKEVADKAAEEAAKAAKETSKAVKDDKSATDQVEKGSDQGTNSQNVQLKTPPKQRYRRIVRWLKENYGDQLKGTTSTEEIEKKLTKIFKADIEPNYINEPKYLKGFKNYIEQRQYGDLVSVD